MAMRFLKNGLALVILSVLLSACAPKPTPPNYPSCSIKGQEQLTHNIERVGGQYVSVGDKTIYVIPTKYIFIGPSKNLTQYGQQLLIEIAKALGCQHRWVANIHVYAHTFGAGKASKALAEQQGQVVLSLLWSYGKVNVAGVKGSETCPRCGVRKSRIEIVTKR